MGKVFAYMSLISHRNSINRYWSTALIPYGWEGNRRSGVALAMLRKLEWFIHLRARGLRKRDQQPTCTPLTGMTLSFYITLDSDGWLGSRVVSVLDSGAEGPGLDRSRDAVG